VHRKTYDVLLTSLTSLLEMQILAALVFHLSHAYMMHDPWHLIRLQGSYPLYVAKLLF
jgi:hypothetical protein